MNKNIEVLNITEIFSDSTYLVPIYQRNYAWGIDEIEQLIEDILSTKLSDTDSYFLGNLIVNQKFDSSYETIDGQQRLTTLFLLLSYIGFRLPNDALKFEARNKSNNTLKNIKRIEEGYLEENISSEIYSGYTIIKNYFIKNNIDKEQFKRQLNFVNIVRVQVPKNIDLNHYFEIMNTRGEQLELHEIAKAKILSQFKNENEKKLAADIWEVCSHMDTYVQMNFSKDVREKLFEEDWSDLRENISSFDKLIYKTEEEKIDNVTSLITILENKNKIQIIDKDIESENERFESIISFPYFLLQVNAVKHRQIDNDTNLDDKMLLSNLKQNWETEEKAKSFIYDMLRLRVIFDKYILKRELAKEYKETGKWSLKQINKYKDNKTTTDKPKYVGTFDQDEEKFNKQIRTLQSSLRITYTSPKTMHWVTLVLKLGYINDINRYTLLEELEKYARNKVKESNFKEAEGFNIDRIIFTYLDYLLYRDGFKYEGEEVIKPLSDGWYFQFRSSIEHFYPQHPNELEKWEKKYLDNFGNLVLITPAANSLYSNTSPAGKVDTYPSVVNQSLKFIVMKAMLIYNNKIWTKELVETHKNNMINLLEKDVNQLF
ncbi:MAG: DUF262 domain-containing protein [Erysipelotrichaceae bacterium]|nr:DUF262 domain-containing protein [Erysipelotrichaceae bacterium]